MPEQIPLASRDRNDTLKHVGVQRNWRDLKSSRFNPLPYFISHRKRRALANEALLQFVCVLLQRNSIVTATIQETPDVTRCELFASHLRILHHVDQFMEQKSIGEWFMRNNNVNKGYRRDLGEAEQIANAHHFRHRVKRRVFHARSIERHNLDLIEDLPAKERLHGTLLRRS